MFHNKGPQGIRCDLPISNTCHQNFFIFQIRQQLLQLTAQYPCNSLLIVIIPIRQMHRLNCNISSHGFSDHLFSFCIDNLHIYHFNPIVRINRFLYFNSRQLLPVMLTAVIKALRILNHQITVHILINKIHIKLLSDSIFFTPSLLIFCNLFYFYT